jgi:WhiB family redox-sensing transcriptional regulator
MQELADHTGITNPLTREALLRAAGSVPGERGWQEQANCLGVDPDLFFPERGASTREAKSVCGSCEVRVECLEYALSHAEKFGIWGGLSERERRRLKRRAS